MSSLHLGAVLTALALYALLAIACFGAGQGIVYAAGRAGLGEKKMPASYLLWIGWASILFAFQVLHFFAPLTAFTAGPVFAAGAALGVAFILVGRKRGGAGVSSGSVQAAVIAILFLPAAVWLASRSMMTPTNYDSGLYHLSTIRWINSFPIVPGLGNLNGRLAFNQSFLRFWQLSTCIRFSVMAAQ